jgi:muramoyltetrapeptide carboxypeptidase LdcA involved in peptidoglycan recycling
MLLPKRLVPESQINLVHTSSPVGKGDLRDFEAMLKRLTKSHPKTKAFDVERQELDPRYLAASERERLKQFRQAIRTADWLLPVYGGTGCADIVRHLSGEDLRTLRERAPIVNGFSDTTYLINFLFFELDLLTFHYSNACGIFANDNSGLFFDVIEGRTQSFSFSDPRTRWLTPPPDRPVEGTAIGGNISTFRDLLDISRMGSASWKPFILFMEDIDLDAEDLHRIVIALDQRKLFRQVRAVVVGRMDESDYASAQRRFNAIFGQAQPEAADAVFPHYIEHLLSEVIEDRRRANDPLHIIKVENFGHNAVSNTMIVPIGGKTLIHPDGKIEFQGPFVK